MTGSYPTPDDVETTHAVLQWLYDREPAHLRDTIREVDAMVEKATGL